MSSIINNFNTRDPTNYQLQTMQSSNHSNFVKLQSMNEKFSILQKERHEFPLEMQEILFFDTIEILHTYKTAMVNLYKSSKDILHNLDDGKHTEQMVCKIMESFPRAIQETDLDGMFPIQKAALHERSVSFVPLLALKGKKRNIGGRGYLGGLLLEYDETKLTVLQTIAVSTTRRSMPNGSEDKYLNVLKQLHSMGFMPEKELVNVKVLRHVHYEKCKKRFRFLFEKYPHALQVSISRDNRDYPLHWAAMSPKSFQMCLKVGMRKYPSKFGYLYQT